MATGLSTHEKALKINLDASIYGSFAEIGAGQEVARWFFRAGAASKTIAKAMSAYDMVFSDAIYGPEESGRYVCESRLEKMLDHEYSLLRERLSNTRGSNTRFFAFADTVAATTFKKNDLEGRGWVGLRFQTRPGGETNEIVIHVRLFDREPLAQQEQLGIFGVNFVYGAFCLLDSPAQFLSNLTESLHEGAVEIEMIRATGPDLSHINNKLLAVTMMELGLTNAVLFAPSGEVVQPSEVLFHKNVLVQRGSFRPFTLLHQDMLDKGREMFCQDPKCTPDNTIFLMEMTTKNLSQEGFINYQDFLDRIEMLTHLGYHVLVSEYPEFFRLRRYINRYTREKIGLLVGAIHLAELFDPDYYKDLKGGMLEAFGLLFSGNVRLFLYPGRDANNQVIRLKSFAPAPEIDGLFQYLRTNKLLVDLENADDKYLHIFSRQTAIKIMENDDSWKTEVPKKVAELIETKSLFKR